MVVPSLWSETAFGRFCFALEQNSMARWNKFYIALALNGGLFNRLHLSP
jgi:hypothetical protein